MSFTQSLVDFRDNLTYDEKTHALAMAKGITNFVVKGLDLTGTTLTSGIFSNTGTFAHLGKEGETHTITSNFTGYIVIKTTLSGSSSTSVIEESATRKDTDQRDTSNIKHFTIYQLNNGTIVQDFRHINYVKSFYLKNMGGSNVAWVLNGFTSETFDASVLAGNRTLLNDKDIDYDDTIHGASALEDILLDLFNKARINVGNDKPFIINFGADPDGILANIGTAIKNFIIAKYGYTIPNNTFNFKMTSATLSTSTNSTFGPLNKVEVWSDGFSFEFPFDYDNFSNTKIFKNEPKQHWSLDELGLDGTWSLTDVPGNIKKAVDKVVSLIGNKTPFTITQPLYRNSSSTHYEFSQAIEDSIVTGYGKGIGTTGLEFRLTMGLTNGAINQSGNLGNFIEIIGNNNVRFIRLYNFTNWGDGNWIDEKGYTSGIATVLYNTSGGFNNDTFINLSESMLNFDTICIEWRTNIPFMTEFNMRSQADDGVTKYRHADTQGYNFFDAVDKIWYSYTDRLSFQFLSPTSIDVINSGAGKYVIRDMGRSDTTSDVVLDDGYGITKIYGINRRMVPRTSIDTNPIFLNMPIVGDNMQDTNEVITND